MPASMNVNNRTVVHKDSGGVATNFPDVCKTQCGPPVVPIPYPNIALSKDTAMGSQSVKVDKNPMMLKGSNFSTSTGDEAGALGGVASSCTKGKAEYINYSFDVKVEGKNTPRLGDMMMQNKGSAFNTPPMPEVQAPLVVPPAKEISHHAQLRIEQITFSKNHIVDKDTSTNFSSPEWLHGRKPKNNAPICYTRNHPIKLTAKFKVTHKPSSSESVAIKGTAITKYATLVFKGSVQVGPSDNDVSVSLSSSVNLPDKVDCIDPLTIEWNYNPASTEDLNAGSSANVLYVVLGDPNGVLPNWTLLDISCRGGAGMSTEDTFVIESFKPFHSTIGKGKAFKRKHDNKSMSYYLQGAGTAGVFSYKDLLKNEGTGRCGAWAKLLVMMHKIHGVTSSRIIGAVPVAAKLLIVKNCSFVGRGTKPAPFMHKGESECVKEDGIFGQGKNNPQFTFGDHALVEHSTGIYDPSYGVGPEPDLKTWEDKGIAGIGSMPYFSMNFDGDEHIMPIACSPGFITHTAKIGDSFASIALKHSITSAGALESHPYNKLPGKPSVGLKPGDTIFIPRELAKKVTILKKISTSQDLT